MHTNKFLRIWDAAEKYLVGTLTTVALALAFYQVVMRYLFNNAPEWAEETVLYLVIWCVFIISSKLVRDNEHIGADFILKRLPVNVRRVVTYITIALCLVFCALLIYYGLQIVSAALMMDERSTTRMRFPMWIAYLSVPTGAVLITMSHIYRLYMVVFHFDPDQLGGHSDDNIETRAEIGGSQ